MDQDATWHGDRPRRGHIVLDGDPTPPHKRGTAAPHFSAMSIVAKRLPISATAELLYYQGTETFTVTMFDCNQIIRLIKLTTAHTSRSLRSMAASSAVNCKSSTFLQLNITSSFKRNL